MQELVYPGICVAEQFAKPARRELQRAARQQLPAPVRGWSTGRGRRGPGSQGLSSQQLHTHRARSDFQPLAIQLVP